jgi:DNA-binding transcriptional LysR family regulator
MTFDQILYFIETAKLEHIGKASRVLRVSPSAISHAIAALEEELGQTFFEKQGKNIVLSQAGRAFLPRSERLMEQFLALKEDFSSKGGFSQTRFAISASHGLAEIVSQRLPSLESTQMTLLSLRSAEVIHQVLEGLCDMGVCFSPQSHPKLRSQVIYTGALRIALNKSHPMLTSGPPKGHPKKTTRHLEELNSFPLCLPKAFVGIENCESQPIWKKNGNTL